MRAITGDVIGLTNGRYGKILDIKNDVLKVSLFPEDIDEPTPVEPEVEYFTRSQVASIR